MKELLIGNAAVARGLYEAGVKVVSSYPGTPSTEITEFAAKYEEIYCEWAPNEKVAVEVGFGASLRGARAACAMKHVGMNVAADPLFTLSYTGVNAGLVLCVADDPAMHSSQNEQDSRHYAVASKVPMLEPADSEEAYLFAKMAFDLSEQYDTPVMLRMCTRIAHCQSIVQTGERLERPLPPYEKQPGKYIMMPSNAKKKHPLVEQRMEALTAYADTCPFNRVEMGGADLGIVTSGSCYQYVKEVFGDSVSVYKLGMVNPLPVESLKKFASSVKRLVVVEELQKDWSAAGRKEHFPDDRRIFPEDLKKAVAERRRALGFGRQSYPHASPGDVLRMSPQRNLLCAFQDEADGFRRHWLLHTGRTGTPERIGFHPVHGGVGFGHSRIQQSRRSGDGRKNGLCHRRFHIHAFGYDGIGEHFLQRLQFHRDYSG